MRKNVKNIVFILALIIFINLGTISAKADEISFAVSPSKITDIVIKPGETYTKKFTMGNKSIFPNNQTEKNDLYKISVNVGAILEDINGVELPVNNILSFDKTTLSAKPGETDEVNVTISIPQDYEEGAYKAYLVFTREPIQGLETTGNTTYTSIKVPIYIFVGDEDVYNSLKLDYNIDDISLNFGDTDKTFWKTVLDYLKKLINPLNVTNTFKEIQYKPIHVIKDDEEIIVDINENFNTDIINVCSTNRVNDWKYVKISKDDLLSEISSINFSNNKVVFELSNKNTVEIETTNDTIVYLQKQLNILSQNISNPTLEYIFNNVKIPINKNYVPYNLSAQVTISNTGDKTAHVVGELNLIKDNITTVANGILNTISIKNSTSETVNVLLNKEESLNDGIYTITGNFKAGTLQKSASKNFNIDSNLRLKIYVTTLIIYILIILILLLIIYLILKRNNKIGYIKLNELTSSCVNKEMSNKVVIKEYRIVNAEELNLKRKMDMSSKTIRILKRNSKIEVLKHIHNDKDDIEWLKVKYIKNNRKDIDDESN